jgi:hypothetical protein
MSDSDPQITFYLSGWYRRRDVASRVAIFFSAATVAGKLFFYNVKGIDRIDYGYEGAFGGILASVHQLTRYSQG